MFHLFSNFSRQKALRAWRNGQIISGYDCNIWRKDLDGSWIRFADYGNVDSTHGWGVIQNNFGLFKGSSLFPVQWQKLDQRHTSFRDWVHRFFA